jgi:hypothetical protein
VFVPEADAEEAMYEYGVCLVAWDDLPLADAIVAAVAHRQHQNSAEDICRELIKGGCFVDVKSGFSEAGLRGTGSRSGGCEPGMSKVVVISRRAYQFVGWVCIDEFEDLFAETCGATIVAPHSRPQLPRALSQMRDRVWSDVSIRADDKLEGDLLLIVARSPSELQSLRAVKEWHKRFRQVAGYVIDSYFFAGFSSVTRQFDHIFTTTREGADFVRKTYGVPTSVLRQGFDCLHWHSVSAERSIDLIGFGRQPPSYHQQFQLEFHRADSPLLYLHSPIGAVHGPQVHVERPMMLKLIQRSKLALAFHMLVEPHGSRPKAMFLTNRWLESLAMGCIVVGKRPIGGMADEMLNWPDATVELPDDASAAAGLVKELAADASYLQTIRRRNVMQMCSQHDWRHRIRDVLQHFSLAAPPRLQAELDALEVKRSELLA